MEQGEEETRALKGTYNDSLSEAARAIAGDKPDQWSRLMGPLRQVAVRLMKQGRIVIRRKGRPVDPDDFRGTYRLALPPAES